MRGLFNYLSDGIWRDDLRRHYLPTRLLLSAVRMVLYAGSAFTTDMGPLRPAGLTMVTLLSLVPAIAILTSIADAMGYKDDLTSFIDSNTRKLPDEFGQVIDAIQGAVDNADFQTLGIIGTGFLFYTTLTLFIRVEAALNLTWKSRRRRPWLRRISDFIALIVLFPVLAIIALGANSVLTGAEWVQQLRESPWLGPLYNAGLGGLTHVVMWGAMTALFRFMPSADVRWFWAFVGGVVAGSGWLFTHTIWIALQIGIARANAIYATAAALPLLIVYLQVVWTVILFGAEIAFAGQHLHVIGKGNQLRTPSQTLRERIALGVVECVAARFESGAGATALDRVARDLDLPIEWLADVCDVLVRAEVLATVDGAPDKVLPSRPVPSIHVHDVLSALRGQADADDVERVPLSPHTLERLAEVERAQRQTLQISALVRLSSERDSDREPRGGIQ